MNTVEEYQLKKCSVLLKLLTKRLKKVIANANNTEFAINRLKADANISDRSG